MDHQDVLSRLDWGWGGHDRLLFRLHDGGGRSRGFKGKWLAHAHADNVRRRQQGRRGGRSVLRPDRRRNVEALDQIRNKDATRSLPRLGIPFASSEMNKGPFELKEDYW